MSKPDSSALLETVPRLGRLITGLSNLDRYSSINISDLAVQLGVSEKQLRHDLELLPFVGVPPFGGGDTLPLQLDEDGYLNVLGELPALDRPVQLSEDQALALAMALKIAGFATDDPLMRKLTAAAGTKLDTALVDQLISMKRRGHNPRVLVLLSEALVRSDHTTFEIRYRSTKGEFTTRVIEPQALFVERDAWYVRAYCHLRKHVQNFRLDRIEDAIAKATPDKQSTVSRSNAPDSPPQKATTAKQNDALVSLETHNLPRTLVRFETSARFNINDWPGAVIKGRNASSITVDIPYTSSTWLAQRITALGGRAIVEYPAELRASIRAFAQEKLTQL